MENQRESFVFYRSFYEAINILPEAQQVQIYKAVMEYSLNQNLIELDTISEAMFKLIKPQLDANNKRFENGKKGGRPKKSETKQEPKQNQSETVEIVDATKSIEELVEEVKPNQTKESETEPKPNNNLDSTSSKPNVNVNVNENVNVNVNVNENEEIEEPPLPTPKKKKEKLAKHKYGKHKHVLLADGEYQTLTQLVKHIDDLISGLDEYIDQSGQTYKSHFVMLKRIPRFDGTKYGWCIEKYIKRHPEERNNIILNNKKDDKEIEQEDVALKDENTVGKEVFNSLLAEFS